jgi:hypothetical protein
MNIESIESPPLPFDVMERVDQVDGVLYSTLINDKVLVGKYGIDKLAENIHRLMSMLLTDVQSEYNEEDGDDYRLTLTDSGRTLLNSLHE